MASDFTGTNQGKGANVCGIRNHVLLKLVDAQIEFVKNEKGEVNESVLHQKGRDVKGVRSNRNQFVKPSLNYAS